MKQYIEPVEKPKELLAREYASEAMNNIKFGVAGWEVAYNAFLAGFDAALHPKKF